MSKDRLVISTEISAYFLWEYTKHSPALDLWYCAEDIAFFFEIHGVYTKESLGKIISLPKKDVEYVEFVRHIAYRIYRFTAQLDSVRNWFAAERLLANGEWVDAVINIAVAYETIRKGDRCLAESIRSERIKKHITS